MYDHAVPGQVTGIVQVAGQLRRKLANGGSPLRGYGVKLVRQQDPRHVGQRERGGTLAGHRDPPDGYVVAGEQSADLLHRRNRRPADRMTRQERNGLPEPAARHDPRHAVEARKRPRRREASSASRVMKPCSQVMSSARSAAKATGTDNRRSTPRVPCQPTSQARLSLGRICSGRTTRLALRRNQAGG
jgi:hypothetical protein